jgi:hypothetical protein
MLGKVCGSDGVVGRFNGRYDRYQANMAAHYAKCIAKNTSLLNKIEDVCGVLKAPTIEEMCKTWADKWSRCNLAYMENNDQHNSIDTTTNNYPVE